MPDAGSALVLPPVARAIPVNPSALTSSSIDAVRDARVPSREIAGTRTVSLSAERRDLSALPVLVTADLRVGSEVGIGAPALRMAAMTSAPPVNDAVPADAAYEPYTLGVDNPGRYAESATLLSEDDSDGLISGAFKKTGASIVRTGVRTGASIVDAVRVVSGAVRRALPN